ncbi:MAG: hypothetical protein IK990_02845 [Ruminiclostridium sp.]|nr:hypothetical protein [Ruminiclostridium sp.]
MKKRIISAALASLMAVSALSTSAFAELAKADQTIKGTGVTAVPTLKVTMPKSMSYIINPYKLTVDAKGKAVAADDANLAGNAQVIPVYGKAADGTTPATAWTITNNSGIAIKTAIYATVTNGNATAVQILDANNGNKDVDGNAADAAKRQINLDLKAGTAAIKFLKAAPTDWTADAGCTVVASTADAGTIDLKLTGTTATGASADALWTSKDVATINVFFKFDFIANT